MSHRIAKGAHMLYQVRYINPGQQQTSVATIDAQSPEQAKIKFKLESMIQPDLNKPVVTSISSDEFNEEAAPNSTEQIS